MTTFAIQNPVTETATTPATYAGHPDFFTEPQAAKALLCARVHFRNGVRDGRFPKPVIFSPRKRFWIKSELEACIQKAIESRGEIHNGVTTELQHESFHANVENCADIKGSDAVALRKKLTSALAELDRLESINSGEAS